MQIIVNGNEFSPASRRFAGFGVLDEGAVRQMEVCIQSAQYGALMADNHKGYAVPIGGVLAYYDAISPSGVGFDIGCGNKAVRLDVPAEWVQKNIRSIMDNIHENISFGIGQKDGRASEDAVFSLPTWDDVPFLKNLKDFARGQLGTVGAGNHYVDVFIDELNRVWVGVHFGSRGLGHKTATEFLRLGNAKDGMDVEPLVLSMQSQLGQDYFEAMNLVGAYAYAGRDFVCKAVAELIGAPIVEEVHNHHNFAWKERHFDTDLYVVRKGATPAFSGQRGFVGGSMGDNAFIIRGVEQENEETQYALRSTIHGAGRAMSRTAAKGKFNRKTGKQISPGFVTADSMMQWLIREGVTLRGGDLDEAPQAYKRINEVIDYHKNTIEIEHTLKPIGVAMAGGGENDPYKD